MEISFYKYQGTGNDFVMIDHREASYSLTEQQIAALCDRKFGIGADGLILLQNHPLYDFQMVYYNADGRESSMCGNGGRCILRFAHDLGIIQNKAIFYAIDGLHQGEIFAEDIKLQMKDVDAIQKKENICILNTGSPHYVIFQHEVAQADLVSIGRKIRYSKEFPEGINVNLTEVMAAGQLQVRTYERGVEDETLSCGTGVVAAVLSHHQMHPLVSSPVKVATAGGNLEVTFEYEGESNTYHQVYLKGKAVKVFEGTIEI